MYVKKDINLADFEAWSGGKDTLDTLIANGHVDDIESVIEELYPDGIDATDLNDFLWFDCEDQYPEYFESDDDDDEDDEEEDEE